MFLKPCRISKINPLQEIVQYIGVLNNSLSVEEQCDEGLTDGQNSIY